MQAIEFSVQNNKNEPVTSNVAGFLFFHDITISPCFNFVLNTYTNNEKIIGVLS